MAGRRGLVAVVDPAGHPLPLSTGSPGAMGRTGTWRTERPIVDTGRCVGCGMCWLYCPEHVIEMTAGPQGRDIAVIDYEYCKGCGVCAQVCPVKAITMVSEEEFLRKTGGQG